MKMCPAGVELFQAADMTKLVVAFRNFAKGPKNNIFSMSGISLQDHFLLQPAVSCSTVCIQ